MTREEKLALKEFRREEKERRREEKRKYIDMKMERKYQDYALNVTDEFKQKLAMCNLDGLKAKSQKRPNPGLAISISMLGMSVMTGFLILGCSSIMPILSAILAGAGFVTGIVPAMVCSIKEARARRFYFMARYYEEHKDEMEELKQQLEQEKVSEISTEKEATSEVVQLNEQTAIVKLEMQGSEKVEEETSEDVEEQQTKKKGSKLFRKKAKKLAKDDAVTEQTSKDENADLLN